MRGDLIETFKMINRISNYDRLFSCNISNHGKHFFSILLLKLEI